MKNCAVVHINLANPYKRAVIAGPPVLYLGSRGRWFVHITSRPLYS